MTVLRYIAEAILLGFLSLIFRLMPVDMASGLGGWIGRTIGPRLAASRKALRHVEAALPALSEQDARAVITGMWDNLGRVIAEYPHLRFIARNRVVFHGGDIIKNIQKTGQAGIFVSGHLANWEVGPASLYEQFGLKVNAMYRAPNNPISDWMLSYFRTLGGRIPALPKSRSGGQNAMRALKNGQTLGILIDQKYNEGVNIPFFGMDAMTNPVAVKFAQKFDVPLFPYFIKRTGGVQFEIHCAAPIMVGEQDDAAVLGVLHTMLEDWITAQPEQWLWLHRRWKDSAVN